MWGAVKGLVKREYRQVRAVDGIDLRVREGEIRAIIGPNGAGKSTTLKILSGILYPTAGSAQVMGMVPWEERKILVRNLGVVFGQKSRLWWDLPPVDSFWLQKTIYDISNPIYEKNVAYFKEHLNLADVMGKPVRQPSLVILDEPTIGLDLFSKEEIREFIHNMNEERGTTFLITTHDLNDVIGDLWANLPLTDLNVKNISIEDVMKEVY